MTNPAQCAVVLDALATAHPPRRTRVYVITAAGRLFLVTPTDDLNLCYVLDERLKLLRILVALD